VSSLLYGDVHTSQGRPSDQPRIKALLVHVEGVLFYHPMRKGGKRQALPQRHGYLQELLLTEGLPAIRAVGQEWFEGFVDTGGV
jgi:hypothetical protein